MGGVEPEGEAEVAAEMVADACTLLAMASPTGGTDAVVAWMTAQLRAAGLEPQRSERGVLSVRIPGRSPRARAVLVHADTIGMMVRGFTPQGRLRVVPMGTHSSRFSEGARVTILAEGGARLLTGTVLADKAAGHIFNEEVDSQPTDWDHVEVRVDELVSSEAETRALGIGVGDLVAHQARPERTPAGFLVSRHLDDKAGCAILLSVARALQGVELAHTTYLVVSVSEEVGTGGAAVVPADTAEAVAVDIAPVGPGQQALEHAAVVGFADKSGPFDQRLSRELLEAGRECGAEIVADVMRHYRTDCAAAVEAGADVRTAVLGFGTDATHGHERTHERSLVAVRATLLAWLQRESGQPEGVSGP